jgi:hypothetical protein
MMTIALLWLLQLLHLELPEKSQSGTRNALQNHILVSLMISGSLALLFMNNITEFRLFICSILESIFLGTYKINWFFVDILNF